MKVQNVEIETVLGSKNRLKILEYLAQRGGVHISQIAEDIGINYTGALRHLELLEKAGLIEETRYGKVRVFEPRFTALEISIIQDEGLTLEITEKIISQEKIETNKKYIYTPKVSEYPLTVCPTLRREVKTRDGFKCVICEKTEVQHLEEYDQALTVHHVDENTAHNFVSNLVTLCRGCHVRIHKKRTKEKLKEQIEKYLKVG